MSEKLKGIPTKKELYSTITKSVIDSIRKQFPDAVNGGFWQTPEQTIADKYRITMGYHGDTKEVVVSIEHRTIFDESKNEFRKQDVHYIFNGQKVKKEGTIQTHRNGEDKVIGYFDDGKIMDDIEKEFPKAEFDTSQVVTLYELTLLSDVLKNPSESLELLNRLPLLPPNLRRAS